LPRIGRTSIATRWRSCGLPQSASCSESFVIPPDVFGQTLRTRVQASIRTWGFALCAQADQSLVCAAAPVYAAPSKMLVRRIVCIPRPHMTFLVRLIGCMCSHSITTSGSDQHLLMTRPHRDCPTMPRRGTRIDRRPCRQCQP